MTWLRSTRFRAAHRFPDQAARSICRFGRREISIEVSTATFKQCGHCLRIMAEEKALAELDTRPAVVRVEAAVVKRKKCPVPAGGYFIGRGYDLRG